MNLELSGRNALVTGSSRGIGRAIAELLHAEGCKVALNGRDAKTLAPVAAGLPGALAIVGDVTQPASAARVVAEAQAGLGTLDIVVCNVGSGRSVPPGDESYEEWQRVFALNLWSATNVIESARPALAATRGCIVCISSICGAEVVPGAPLTYSAAKAALHAYVRGAARPLGKAGVRINAVAPGNILVDGSVWTAKLAADADAVRAMLQREVSLGEFGSAKDVAQLVAYLVSPRAGFATGAVWTLDGGQVRA